MRQVSAVALHGHHSAGSALAPVSGHGAFVDIGTYTMHVTRLQE